MPRVVFTSHLQRHVQCADMAVSADTLRATLEAVFAPAIKDECRVPVDGKLVVTRTRDGGRHFEVLSRGLPQQHAYDLVYRHGLALDDEGRCLAMGSTTGNLYVTANQGDEWRCVANNLPPIYSVRFAS